MIGPCDRETHGLGEDQRRHLIFRRREPRQGGSRISDRVLVEADNLRPLRNIELLYFKQYLVVP